MPDNRRRKQGNARLANHDRYGRQKAPSPNRVELLDLAARVKAQFTLSRAACGTAPSRAYQKTMDGDQQPLHTVGKRVLEMFDRETPVPVIKATTAVTLDKWIDDLAAKRNGRNPDPTTPAGAIAIRKAA